MLGGVGWLCGKSLFCDLEVGGKLQTYHQHTVCKILVYWWILTKHSSWNQQIFANVTARGLPIQIPSTCWYIVLLKLNLYTFGSNRHEPQENIFWNRRGWSKWLWYRMSAQMVMVSSKGTLVYELAMSNEQKNELLQSIGIFWIWFTKVNKSQMQCSE